MNSDLTGDASVPLTDDPGNETIVNGNTIIKVIKQLVFFLLIYFVGYFGFSAIWALAPVIIVFLHNKWREERRAKLERRHAIAVGFEKDIILNSLEELPAWIKFPDIEKVEWLNRIFKHIWQEVNEYSSELIPKIFEPSIQYYDSGFKFTRVVLGNVPLRVDGVEVLNQEDDRKIVMDLDISYAGDCDITFQTFKFTGGIKSIQFHGRVRVVLTPLISRIPIIGGLQVYFTKEPRIRFDLNKITQILDLPVIHTKIHNTVMKIVNSKFLYPNAYSINLTQGINMSRLTVFRTEGVLRVHVVEGKNLVNKDFIGKSDPYVVMSVASIRVETPVVQNSLNPKWDFWTEFEIDCNSELKVEVFDKDEGSKDDFLGCTKLDIAEVVRTGQVDKLMHLQDVKQGMIHIRLWWLSLSSDYTDLEAAINDTKMLSPHIHTALLMIYLESSLNLPMHHKTEPTPYVKLEIENKTKKTDPEQQTCQPLWDKGFTFMIRDPKRAVLNITVVDNDSERNIGELSFQIDSLSNEPNIELKRHTFFFNKPYSDASICCTMKLRLFKNEKSSDEENDVESTPKTRVLEKQKSTASTKSKISRTSVSSGSVATDWENESWYFSNQDSSQYDITAILGKIKLSLFYSEQRQKLIVYIYEVKIENSSSTHDPYVKLYLQTNIHPDHKKKTKAIKNTNNPVYNKEIDYLISTQDLNFTCLVVVVESDRGFFDVRKKFLGHTIISLKNCAELNEPIISWFDLIQKNEKYVHHLIK